MVLGYCEIVTQSSRRPGGRPVQRPAGRRSLGAQVGHCQRGILYCVRWVSAAGGPGLLRARRPGWPLPAGDPLLRLLGLCCRWSRVAASSTPKVASAGRVIRCCASWAAELSVPGWRQLAGGSGAVSGVAGAVGGCGPPRSRRLGWLWIRYCVRWVSAAGGPGLLRARRQGWPLPAGLCRYWVRRVCASGGPGLLRARRQGWPLPAGLCRYWVRRVCASGGPGLLRARRSSWPVPAGWCRYYKWNKAPVGCLEH